MGDDVDLEAARAKPFWKRSKAEADAIYADEKDRLRSVKARAADERAEREERKARLSEQRADQKAERRRAQAERQEKAQAAAAASPTFFEGAVLEPAKGVVSYKGRRVGLPATARVETAGDIHRRVTATRMVAVGVFAFALKKKKDDRTLYLTVEGEGDAFVMELKPKLETKAREFAARVSSASPPTSDEAPAC